MINNFPSILTLSFYFIYIQRNLCKCKLLVWWKKTVISKLCGCFCINHCLKSVFKWSPTCGGTTLLFPVWFTSSIHIILFNLSPDQMEWCDIEGKIFLKRGRGYILFPISASVCWQYSLYCWAPHRRCFFNNHI